MAENTSDLKSHALKLSEIADNIAAEQIDQLSAPAKAKIRKSISVASEKLKLVISSLTADKTPDIKSYAAQLTELVDSIAAEQIDQLSAPAKAKIRKSISAVSEKLTTINDNLDNYKQPSFIFDPSNPIIAGRVAAMAMIVHPRYPLNEVDSFYGAGIYAIYYKGDYPLYAPIKGKEHPIYVGKADPETLQSATAIEQGPKLTGRLKDHRRNIRKAKETLSIDDFEYRTLVIKTGYQEAAESYLIDLFKPIWNWQVDICYGFGKHGDDPETRANKRSPWDTLHEGRDWAGRDETQEDAFNVETIKERVEAHFKAYPPLATLEDVIAKFINDMREAT